jgi:hypothetical protein
MENLNSKLYRKGLAASLGEIRNSGEDGSKNAKFFLDLAKKTTLYQEAEVGQRKVSRPMTEQHESREGRGEEMIHELLELISTNKDYRFGVSVNGRLNGKEGSTIGQFGYLLDQGNKSFVRLGNNTPLASDPNVYSDQNGKAKLYTPNLRATEVKTRDAKSVIKYQGWMLWDNDSRNPFTFETRGALTFAGGLFICNTEEAVRVVSEGLFKAICAPENEETKRVMWKFFIKAFKKYAPEYWRFVEKKWQEQSGNKNKDITSYFD